MARTEYEVTRKTLNGMFKPGFHNVKNKDFRDAPVFWDAEYAEQKADEENMMKLEEDHWETIRVLQGCYAQEERPRTRLLHDALEARFGPKGGMQYLYKLFIDGPIAQGCRLAGLDAPAGSVDKSFGSVR